MQCMNKSPIEKRLSRVCSVSVDNIPTTRLFCYNFFRQWQVFLWKHNLISQDHCGMLSHGIFFQATEIYFTTSLSYFIQASMYFQPHVSYILSNTNGSSSHAKILSNWSKTTIFVFHFISSSIEWEKISLTKDAI